MMLRRTGLLSIAVSGALLLTPAASHAAVDVVELTAEQIQTGYMDGLFTATELTQAYLDRIAALDPTYNAFITVMGPEALAQAAAIDAELASTGTRGGLFGVPVVLKDNMDVAGQLTTNGYFGFSAAAGGVDLIPFDDATIVRRLKDAGAILLGKTNLPDFAQAGNTNSSIIGQTLNAYGVNEGKRFTPGGSSGGTATAVSLSMGALGFGTETFGSIQNPSAAQGLVGFRPTYGMVPIEGIFPLKASRDVAGPMARSVTDAAIALDVIAGPSGEDLRTRDAVGNMPEQPFTSYLDPDALQGARIGVYEPVWGAPLDPEVASLYQQTLSTVTGLGATIVDEVFEGSDWMSVFTSPPAAGDVFRYDVQDYLSKLGPTSSFDSIQSFEQQAGFAFGEGSLTRPVQALANSIEGDIFEDPGFIAEVLWQKQLLDTFRAIMDAKDLDALIYPYSFITVPSLGGPNNFPLAVPEVSLMGIPLVTVPVDLYDSGAPFAVTVIGRDKWTDEQILGYAYALEQALLGQGKGRFAPTAIPEPGGLAIMLLTAGMLLLRTDTRRAMDRSAGDSVAA